MWERTIYSVLYHRFDVNIFPCRTYITLCKGIQMSQFTCSNELKCWVRLCDKDYQLMSIIRIKNANNWNNNWIEKKLGALKQVSTEPSSIDSNPSNRCKLEAGIPVIIYWKNCTARYAKVQQANYKKLIRLT